MTADCCSRERPHPTIEAMPRDGQTHYVGTIMDTALPVSPGFARLLPQPVRSDSVYQSMGKAELIAALEERDERDRQESEAGETPYDLGQHIQQLEARIAKALELMKLAQPSRPYNAWVNAHPSIIKLHEARVVLGAEQ